MYLEEKLKAEIVPEVRGGLDPVFQYRRYV
jgi:hypothetical protein